MTTDAAPHVDLESSVGYLVKDAATELRLAMEAVLRPLGMTVTHYSCLELLAQRPGISNSELARRAFVTRQSMHALLAALERDGEVVRPAEAASGRVLPVRLTEAGSVRLAAASAAVRGVELRMLSGLDDAGVAALRTLLTSARDALRGSRARPGARQQDESA